MIQIFHDVNGQPTFKCFGSLTEVIEAAARIHLRSANCFEAEFQI